jgi:diguanylate cyclase (GGDEF)-like protein
MTERIGSVPDLADLRPKYDMEVALATVIRRVAQAKELRLWRVVRTDGERAFREHIALPGATAGTKAQSKAAQGPELADSGIQADLRRCFETRAHLRRTSANSDLFPGFDGRDIVYLLEIRRPTAPTRDQKLLILKMLRIYCSLATTLNASDRDELTGLLNRRTFDHIFNEIAAPIKAAGSGGQLPKPERRRGKFKSLDAHLAVIDIDFFKRISEQFGQAGGDQVRVLLAGLMTECFRDHDRIFRFGGGRFVMLLTNTDFQDAEAALERFRARVEDFQFSQAGRITVSIGLAKLQPDDSGQAAFTRAAQALKVAEKAGRNQIQYYELLVANGTLAPTVDQQEFESTEPPRVPAGASYRYFS